MFCSYNISSFNEKQQRLVKDGIDILKSIVNLQEQLDYSKVFGAKLNFMAYALNLFVSLPLKEAFSEWCSASGVELGVLFVGKEDVLRPIALYKGPTFPEDVEIEIGARSIVRLAYEKNDSYIYETEKIELFDGYNRYAVVIPIRKPMFDGVLVLASPEEDFFSTQLQDVLNSFSYILGIAAIAVNEAEQPCMEPLEIENRLKIMASRAQREDKILGILLFTVKNIEKEYQRRGLWDVESRMNEVYKKASLISPSPEVLLRLTDNAILMARIFDDLEQVQSYKQLFNTATADVLDF